MANWIQSRIAVGGLAVVTGCACGAAAVTDGFGDGDRNNDGAISELDSDTLTRPLDAADTGLIWQATRGHTPNGDRKSYLAIIDDSAGDADSPGLQSGYALGVEGKGSGGTFAGFLRESVVLGPNVGDRVEVGFDFRGWSQSAHPTVVPVIGELRFGVYQDSDDQFGETADRGFEGNPVVWGDDTGINDGEWREADPGPVGDKGFFVKIPIGLAADPLNNRIIYEHNQRRFLEGQAASRGGDTFTVANPNDDGDENADEDAVGDGGAVFELFEGHTVKLSIVRTDTGMALAFFIDGVLVLGDAIDLEDAELQALGVLGASGALPDSFDYIAFRNTEEWDMIIDNVSIEAIPAVDP